MQYMAILPQVFFAMKELDKQTTYEPQEPLIIGLACHDSLNTTPANASTSLNPVGNDHMHFTYLNNLEPITAPCSIDIASATQTNARTSLLIQVQNLKHALYFLGSHMNAKLADGTTVFELPSIEENTPIPTTYHFNNWRDMTAYNCFWSVVILTNKVMMRLLPPFDPTIYNLQSESRSLALEICKTWDDAWASKPIGAFHTGLSFVVAFEYCTADVQEWIVTGLNSLLDYHLVDAFRWSREVVAMMSSKLAGEGPDLTFSNPNFSNEVR